MDHPPRLARLPPAISRWLGYRASPPKPVPPYAVWAWSFLSAFCGIATIQAVFRAQYFVERGVPSIVASYGASAVLIYGAIESPLAQPRNLIGGHFVGALTGIIINKLFQLLPPERYLELQWLGGSLSVGLAIAAMQMTGTVHPPAGATALFAAINPQVIAISWYLLPVVLLSSTVGLCVSLIINNVQRRYPMYWFTPIPPRPQAPAPPLSNNEDDKTNTPSTEGSLLEKDTSPV